jgi:hypothetical protein
VRVGGARLDCRSMSTLLTTPMDICWQFTYALDDDKLKALYAKAKRQQWDAEADLDWSCAVDPERPPVADDQELAGVMRVPLVQQLGSSQRQRLLAHLAALRLSQFLHGEQGALMTAAALTHAVPDHQGKLYAATQTMDEARHVEVFARYIQKLALIYPMSSALKELIDRTLTADHWVKIAIGMNMIVEGLALAHFHNMLKVTPCALLRSILQGVLRDESRHVAFGALYVRDAIAAMQPDEREDVADFAFEIVSVLRRSGKQGVLDPGFVRVLDECGIDSQDFLRSVAQLRASGERVELPRDQIHPFKHLMMPALVRVGAVTARSRERFAAEGIPVWEDRRALEQLEQDPSFG